MLKEKNDPKYFDKMMAANKGKGGQMVLKYMGIDLACQLIKFTMLAFFLVATHSFNSPLAGALGGMWVCIGFEIPQMFAHSTWENRPSTIPLLFVVKNLAASVLGGAFLAWCLNSASTAPAA